MEPRKEQSKKSPEHKEERKSRFQIVKLEERIAPGTGPGTINGRGCGGGICGNCGHGGCKY